MDVQELQEPENVPTIWVKNLNKTVNKIINTKSLMTGIKPKDAIKLDTVPLNENYPEETVLPNDGLSRYRYQPDEQHGDQKRRARDLIWSKNTYRLYRIIQGPGNCVLCYLQDRPHRSFTISMLQRQVSMADDDEFEYIVKNSQRVLRLNDQYKNHPFVDEFTKEHGAIFLYGTYVLEGEVVAKFSLDDIWTIFQEYPCR